MEKQKTYVADKKAPRARPEAAQPSITGTVSDSSFERQLLQNLFSIS